MTPKHNLRSLLIRHLALVLAALFTGYVGIATSDLFSLFVGLTLCGAGLYNTVQIWAELDKRDNSVSRGK